MFSRNRSFQSRENNLNFQKQDSESRGHEISSSRTTAGNSEDKNTRKKNGEIFHDHKNGGSNFFNNQGSNEVKTPSFGGFVNALSLVSNQNNKTNISVPELFGEKKKGGSSNGMEVEKHETRFDGPQSTFFPNNITNHPPKGIQNNEKLPQEQGPVTKTQGFFFGNGFQNNERAKFSGNQDSCKEIIHSTGLKNDSEHKQTYFSPSNQNPLPRVIASNSFFENNQTSSIKSNNCGIPCIEQTPRNPDYHPHLNQNNFSKPVQEAPKFDPNRQYPFEMNQFAQTPPPIFISLDQNEQTSFFPSNYYCFPIPSPSQFQPYCSRYFGHFGEAAKNIERLRSRYLSGYFLGSNSWYSPTTDDEHDELASDPVFEELHHIISNCIHPFPTASFGMLQTQEVLAGMRNVHYLLVKKYEIGYRYI